MCLIVFYVFFLCFINIICLCVLMGGNVLCDVIFVFKFFFKFEDLLVCFVFVSVVVIRVFNFFCKFIEIERLNIKIVIMR